MSAEHAHIFDGIVRRINKKASPTISTGSNLSGIRSPSLEDRTTHKRTPEEQEQWERMWGIVGDLRFLRDYYGVKVVVGSTKQGDLDHVAYKRWKIPEIVRADIIRFKQELGMYPPEFVRFCRLSHVRFSETLSLSDHAYWQGNRKLGGLAISTGQMYLTSNGGKETIHHEIFHRADQESNDPWLKKEKRWRKLNRRNKMPYIHSIYWKMNATDRNRLPFPGYASPYGRVDAREDRATVQELLMTDPQEASERAMEDPVFYQKLGLVMLDLCRWSNGKMNRQYFNDLFNGEVQAGYWK